MSFLHDLFHHPAKPPITNRDLAEFLLHLERSTMTAISDAAAKITASVAALTTEVAASGAKVDALIALAQASASSGTPVDQADLDALTAAGNAVDAATASLTAEDAKVDAALTPAPAPVDAPVDTPVDPTAPVA